MQVNVNRRGVLNFSPRTKAFPRGSALGLPDKPILCPPQHGYTIRYMRLTTVQCTEQASHTPHSVELLLFKTSAHI